jgi:acetyl esterase/lipase
MLGVMASSRRTPRADVTGRLACRLARRAALALPLVLSGCAVRGPAAAPAGAPAAPDCATGGYLDRQFRDVAVRRGVVYSRPTDAYGVHELRMDLYRAQGDGARTRPAIVWLHGGNFRTGDRTQLSEFARQFAQRGYLSAAIDYRLLRELAPLSRGVDKVAQSDAQAAIRYLRLHAEELGLDPERIAIAGHSAGSITAFNVGYRHEFSGDNADNPGPPHTVSAVLGIEGHLIRPEDIEPGDPPFELLRSGRSNPRERPADVEPLLARAKELGIPARTHVVQGATHQQLIREPHLREVISQAAPFLQRFLACS